MRRSAIAILVLLAALTLPQSALAGPRTSARAELVECVADDARFGSYAEFRGTMNGHRSRRMQMRFTVFERRPDASRYRRVRAPDLDVWREAASGVERYRRNHVLRNLTAGAEYRATITFRWRNRAGRIVRQVKRRTGVCSVDTRPRLRIVDGFVRRAGMRGMLQYIVVVTNRSGAEATDVEVELRIDGVRQGEPALIDVPAYGRVRTIFIAPRCRPGTTVEAIIRPAEEVDEGEDGDGGDTLTRTCGRGDGEGTRGATLLGR